MATAALLPRTLLVIPPLTQLNTPYPSTAYLTGFLRTRGCEVAQADVGMDMVLALFSKSGLARVFEILRAHRLELQGEAKQMLALAPAYVDTIDPVIRFLQGRDSSLATRIVQRTLLPEGPRFARLRRVTGRHLRFSATDHAKHLATLYLEDLSDLIGQTIAPQFALSRYAEHVGTSASTFDQVLAALEAPPSLTDHWAIEALERQVRRHEPTVIGLTVPFPGNLYGAFRLAQAVRARWPAMKLVLGGGYVNTELRRLTDPRVFDYVDYVTLDDGERPLLSILESLAGLRNESSLTRTFVRTGHNRVDYLRGTGDADIRMDDTGTPTYDGLDLERYLSILDTTNPMHRLWSDGHWNKLTVAHGCYWKQCTFCDVSLDYIGRYDATRTTVLLDRIEALVAETGRRGFHFVDEAAPPAALKALAIGLLERGLSISWWGNIRFEKSFTPDLCRLLAASGCIAVSAGLEVASDRLLTKMKKGITVDQTARVAAAFRAAGILIHAYLMYGFPSETVDETVESLERVRQLFAADLVQSAFWHRFVATAHSPVGLDPKSHGIKIVGPSFAGFADNDLIHIDVKGDCPEWLGKGLRLAVGEFVEGRGFSTKVPCWFERPVRVPRVSRFWASQAAAHADTRQSGSLRGRLIWLGTDPIIERWESRTTTLVLPSKTEDTVLRLPHAVSEWLIALLRNASPIQHAKQMPYPLLSTAREGYPLGGLKKCELWMKSPAWRELRRAGLLIL
ncbi:radical SAM protein [Nitrospira sp.]|nr:radical SAM protein [Nitrospira sp.]